VFTGLHSADQTFCNWTIVRFASSQHNGDQAPLYDGTGRKPCYKGVLIKQFSERQRCESRRQESVIMARKSKRETKQPKQKPAVQKRAVKRKTKPKVIAAKKPKATVRKMPRASDTGSKRRPRVKQRPPEPIAVPNLMIEFWKADTRRLRDEAVALLRDERIYLPPPATMLSAVDRLAARVLQSIH
jgi:hypothetical protein